MRKILFVIDIRAEKKSLEESLGKSLAKNFGNTVGDRQASQVGFAEFNNTADNPANIGGTIIGAPIVGQ